jgi:hypothetical protein
VNRLDESGGDVTVDGTACYDELDQWQRNVVWNVDEMTVTDNVRLSGDKKEVVLFRFHLGTEEDVSITTSNGAPTVTWEDAEMTFEGTTPLSVTQVKMPDHTLKGHDGSVDPKNVHICVIVQSAGPCNEQALTTRIVPR